MRRKKRIGRCRSPLRRDPISREGKKDYKRERRPEIYKHYARKIILTVAVVSTWLISAATPGVPAISYKERSVTRGLSFMRSPRGCPIPPAAPNTATFRLGELELEMHLVCAGLLAADTTDLFKRTATDLLAAIFFTDLTSTTTIAKKKKSPAENANKASRSLVPAPHRQARGEAQGTSVVCHNRRLRFFDTISSAALHHAMS